MDAADKGMQVARPVGAAPPGGKPGEKPGDQAPTVRELFTPQEEAFLRAYADSVPHVAIDERPLRSAAMASAGFVAEAPTLDAHQAIVAKAGELLARAEQLSLSQVSSSIGGDKVAFCAVLWSWCQSESGNHALKALMLMGRIHGMWEKGDTRQPQVALIFNQAQAPPGTLKPADLPFTLSSADYRPYPAADNENEAKQP